MPWAPVDLPVGQSWNNRDYPIIPTEIRGAPLDVPQEPHGFPKDPVVYRGVSPTVVQVKSTRLPGNKNVSPVIPPCLPV